MSATLDLNAPFFQPTMSGVDLHSTVLTPEQIIEFYESFEIFAQEQVTTGHKTEATLEEYKTVLKSLTQNLTDEQVTALFEKTSYGKNTVNYNEFLNFMAYSISVPATDDELKEFWKIIEDKNNKGFADLEEFRFILENVLTTRRLTVQQVDELYAEFCNNDKKLTYDGFVKMYNRNNE